MSSLFSTPKIPQPTAAAQYSPAPARSDAAVQEDMEAERRRRAAATGRGSTLLTGTSDMAQPSGQKTLLGS